MSHELLDQDRRIALLERSVRRMRVVSTLAIAILGAVALMGAVDHHDNEMVVRRGNDERIHVGFDNQTGAAGLEVIGRDKPVRRILLSTDENDAPVLSMFDQTGVRRVHLGINPANRPFLELVDINGNRVALP